MIASVRPARVSDARIMFIISRRAHLSGYDSIIKSASADRFQRKYADTVKNSDAFIHRITRKLATDNTLIMVSERGTIVVGYVIATRYRNGVYIDSLFVDPDGQGIGVGSALLGKVLRWSQNNAVCLHVAVKNHRAIRLYQRHGFSKTVPIPETFYGAHLMRMTRPNN